MTRTHWPACGLAASLLFSIGCGPPHVSVQGKVTYLDEAVTDGAIRFFPIDGTAGAGAATSVRNGAYQFAPEDGLVRGKYRVEITAVKATGREIPRLDLEPGQSPTIPESLQYLPPCYNYESKLQVELIDRENQHSFSLKESEG